MPSQSKEGKGQLYETLVGLAQIALADPPGRGMVLCPTVVDILVLAVREDRLLESRLAVAPYNLGHPDAHSVVEELVQETLVAMVTGLAGFDRRSSFRHWLFTILRNKWVDAGRRAGSRAAVIDLDDDGWLDAAGTNRHSSLVADQALLRQAMAYLPGRWVTLIQRLVVGGEPQAVVRQDLGLTDGQLRGELYRAKAELRAVVLDLTGQG